LQLLINLYMFTPIETKPLKGRRREIGKATGRSSRDDKIVGLRMMKDAPHRLDIFRRPPPIALDSKVAKLNSALVARSNATGGANDLFCDKALCAQRGLVVEQYSVGSKQTIGIAIIYNGPMRSCFCHRIGTTWAK